MENNLQEIKTALHFQAVFTTQSHIFKSYFIKSCKILEGLWGSPFASHSSGRIIIIVLVVLLFFKNAQCFLLNLTLHQIEYVTKSERF